MRTLVIERPDHVSLSERPVPEVRTGEVLVRPLAVGICGSDVHAYMLLQLQHPPNATNDRVPASMTGWLILNSRVRGVENTSPSLLATLSSVMGSADGDRRACSAGAGAGVTVGVGSLLTEVASATSGAAAAAASSASNARAKPKGSGAAASEAEKGD